MVSTNMMIGFGLGLTIGIVQFFFFGSIRKNMQNHLTSGDAGEVDEASKDSVEKAINFLNFIRWITLITFPLFFAYAFHVAIDGSLL